MAEPTNYLISLPSAQKAALREGLKEQLLRWRGDIVDFCRRGLNVEPTGQQLDILTNFQRPGSKTAVKAGHGVGKTAAASWCCIWSLLVFEDVKVAVTAPAAAQLEDALLPEIGKTLQSAHPWVAAQFNVQKMAIEIIGAEATRFLTARTARPEKPDALQGLHADNMVFVIDEAFGVADSIFAVVRGALTSKHSRALMLGNPTATSGYAYNAFNRNSHIWHGVTLSCLNSPLASKEYAEEMKSEYGEDSDEYKVRVLGEFPRASISQLIPRALAEEAAKRKITLDRYSFAPVVLGVDVAWEGDDRSVIYKRQGLASSIVWSGMNVDTMTLGALVNQFWGEHKADAVFIDMGWGAGVIDYLRSVGRNPIPVNFGERSTSNEYRNKRTQMWCEMKKWLCDGGVIPLDKQLIDDLVGPTYSFTSGGQKQLEAKKMMKKRGIKSPDFGDALALTFAETVVKRDELRIGLGLDSPDMSLTDYDIFGDV